MKPANESPRYRKFVDDRNKALEEILQKYLVRIDKIVVGLQNVTKEIVSYSHERQQDISYVEQRLDQAFNYAAGKTTELTKQLGSRSYTLAYAGEVEALSRAKGEIGNVELSRNDIELGSTIESPAGGALVDRMRLYLQRLRRRVLDAVEMGFVNNETIETIDSRIESAFPPRRKVKRPKRVIKPRKLKEAAPKVTLTVGQIDDEAWDNLVQDYLSRNVPSTAPEDIISMQAGEIVDLANWEVPKEVTEYFIQNVRDAQVAAAEEQGVKEFMWIAVIDNKTDECCLWRDGKTTSEIKKLLRTSKKGDKCKAVAPPAHFNCRCDLAPMTELPGETPEDIGEFEEWLTS